MYVPVLCVLLGLGFGLLGGAGLWGWTTDVGYDMITIRWALSECCVFFFVEFGFVGGFEGY